MDNPFWNFSLAVYNRPGVPEACLRLQDECGADVNLVLFILWQACEGREMTPRGVAEIEAAVGDWPAEVVRPLREVRRWLKKNPLADDRSGALRDEVKKLELDSERLQQERMAGLPIPGHRSATDTETATTTALGHYAALLKTVFPAAPVSTVSASAAELAELS
ncbi:MAG: TIGR02444 family protein [bacterium]